MWLEDSDPKTQRVRTASVSWGYSNTLGYRCAGPDVPGIDDSWGVRPTSPRLWLLCPTVFCPWDLLCVQHLTHNPPTPLLRIDRWQSEGEKGPLSWRRGTQSRGSAPHY